MSVDLTPPMPGFSVAARPCWLASDILRNPFSASVCNVYDCFISPQADARPCRRTTVSALCALALASGFILQCWSSEIFQVNRPPDYGYFIFHLGDIGRHIYRKPSLGTSRSKDWHHRALFIRMLIFVIIVGVGSLYVSLIMVTPPFPSRCLIPAHYLHRAALFSGLNSYDYPRLVIQAICQCTHPNLGRSSTYLYPL